MKIQTNSSGTRSIEIADQHLQTIEKYQLFRDLIDSNGYVDEQVLDKLKLNIRSLLEGDAGKDKDLLDLCAATGSALYQLEESGQCEPRYDNSGLPGDAI